MAAPDQPESAEATLIVAPSEVVVGSESEASPTDPQRPVRRGRSEREREFQRGDEVGRYVILERVGAGGMGVVYAAWDPKLDRKVALKLLHGDQAGQRDRGQRLEREAQAMARLTHPNVITVHDVGEVGGRVFVAMEFVEGETLGGWARLEARAEPRPWSETLEVLLAAGRGLAAAHAEGLIHRDFKPDNVMIGADGRVRVMDFGLVRAAAPGSESGDNSTRRTGPRSTVIGTEDLAVERRAALEASGDLSFSGLDSELTLAGALLGTPAYMAPEQLQGEDADARADQFSYCVAAWQCLWGVRPFRGDSPLAVLFAIAEGQFREPPPGRTVPTWVRRALERGLASDPGARWPDMAGLLAALGQDPRSRRRPWLLAGGSLLVAAAAAVTAIVLERPQPAGPCDQAGDELRREDWSDSQRATLAAAFAASELVYADETWERVESGLDAWAEEWTSARRAACEDTHLRHQQSPELLDRRMACLDQRRDRFAALVELFAAADDTVIEKAVEAVEAVPSLAVCSDRSWLTASVRPPEDPSVAAAVTTLREDLARVVAMTDAGKAADARELAVRLDREASALEWTPIVAEASVQLGRVHQELGEFAEARVALERAYFAARRSSHDEVTVQAGFLHIYGLDIGLADYASAALWIDHVLAEAERVGRPDLLAEVYAGIGIHRYTQSEIELAAAAFARSVELHSGGASSSLAAAHINYGTILARVDPNLREQAFAELDLGLTMLEASIGAQHPTFAAALSNYATVRGLFGEHREAIALLDRALEISVRAMGDEHPMVGLIQLNLATNLIEVEDGRDRALALANQSLATHRAVFGDQHAMVAQSERVLAITLLRHGRARDAMAHVENAVTWWTANLGETNPETLATRLTMARCELALGHVSEARATLEGVLSLELDDKKLRASASLDLAELLVDEDRERAADLLVSAKPYFEDTGDERSKQRIADLTRALRDSG